MKKKTAKSKVTKVSKVNKINKVSVSKLAVEPYNATKAFEQYYALGDSRSISQVVKLTGGAFTTVQRYSQKYFWQDRVVEMIGGIRAIEFIVDKAEGKSV